MIHICISWWLEKNQKFSETQYGFWQNKGCTDNLAILMTDIIKVFEDRNVVSALFLDIKSAYDDVHCGTLMDRLKAAGFSGKLLAFIFNLVSSRKLEADCGWLDLSTVPLYTTILYRIISRKTIILTAAMRIVNLITLPFNRLSLTMQLGNPSEVLQLVPD
jgi:hypothetical protein